MLVTISVDVGSTATKVCQSALLAVYPFAAHHSLLSLTFMYHFAWACMLARTYMYTFIDPGGVL